MSFDPSHLLSQLSAMDREKGDIKLQCQGDEVKAHSFVLGMSLEPWSHITHKLGFKIM